MNHTYHIKMRTMLWAILGVACFASAPPVAFGGWVGDTMCACPGQHRPLGNASSCEEACGLTSSGGNSSPSYDYGAAQRAQEAAAAAEAERQRQAEADRVERERKAEEKRQKDAAFIRDRDAAANSLKGSTGSAMDQLKGLAGTDNSGLKGSAFDTGGQLKDAPGALKGSVSTPRHAKPAPHTDTSVVDARVPRDGAYLTAQVPELKNSPAADRITKGFQAVINHDWPVALAWWQDALNRDPNNAALKRSVDLAQWMVDKRKAKAAEPATPLAAAIHSASRGDNAEAIRQFELVKKENPASAPQIDDMINALRQRQAKDSKDAKSAAYWSGEIKKGTQQMVDEMFETGMNRLSIGDEKGAQKAFNDATFFGLASNVRPSQLPASKSGRSAESAPVFKTLPDGRVLQLPSDSDIELLFPGTYAQPPASKSGRSAAPTPTFIIGKGGQLIQVPENSDQESPTYIKGKDGKLIEVPQPQDSLLMFPVNSPATTPKSAGESGKTK